MRDPRDVLRGRIDQRINRKAYDAQVAARIQLDKGVKSAVDKGKGVAPKKKAKKKMGWWPFGSKEEQAAAGGSACHACAQQTDPSWGVCPYCGADLAGGAPEAAPVGQAPVPNAGPMVPVAAPGVPNKTVAIDLDAMAGPQRSVVGWLVAMSGVQKGMDFRVYEGANSIGAAADCEIVITDEYLSALHASIRYEDGRYELRDNDSTNGSFVNEKKISREELIDNDTVRLGRTEFRFKSLY